MNVSKGFLLKIIAFKAPPTEKATNFGQKAENFGAWYLDNRLNFLEKFWRMSFFMVLYKITENKANLKTSLPDHTLFCPFFSENGSYKALEISSEANDRDLPPLKFRSSHYKIDFA